MTAVGITIVGASAGSGKTYRLTEEVTKAVSDTGAHRVGLEGLVAVTYTRKAHAELAARIRQKLVRAGAFDEALRLPLAYLGTVHAACLRLLQEFALDAGLSPHIDVVAGDQAKLLRQALETTLAPDLRHELDRLAMKFELRLDQKTHRVDWLTPVGDIMDLARSNRIAPDDLAEMGRRSADGLLGLFGTPVADGAALDDALRSTLATTLQALSHADDTTKATAKALEVLHEVAARMDDDELVWRHWAKLSTLSTGADSRDLVAPLHAVASQYERHPRLHAELRELTLAIFDAAASGLSGYQAWKARLRVVDYVDMLDRALVLLESPRVREELGARLQLAVVDEFQDTSPIQLSLFVELHKLAGRSVWVGDRKQCIFEYAGADPLLMDAVSTWVEQNAGRVERLGTNYRSRPELVATCSSLFAKALARHGFTADEVNVGAHRASTGIENLPALGLFRLDVSNKDDAAVAIAVGVRRLLDAAGATPVIDRTTKQARPVRAGDIAVIVATNAEASSIAAALHARGVRAALAREGLLSTPEGTLVDSALRWLIDGRDSLASTTIDALTGFGGRQSEEWLEDRLRNPSTEESSDGWRQSLGEVRAELSFLSPSEAVDRVVAALDLVELCARWPDAPQRVSNIDALRALAAVYEERCTEEREAATVAGLLRYFDAIRMKTLRRDEMLASDAQHVPSDDDSVTVCTYHKAKGLEWPVVVLASLERGERRDAFDVSPESDSSAFDPEHPLAGRWIRYWPWPFGGMTNAPLWGIAQQSPEGQQIALREEKERARLLYVGFTRARDHLVLAVRVKTTRSGSSAQTDWLNALADEAGEPLLTLPIDAADDTIGPLRIETGTDEAMDLPMRVWHLRPLEATQPAETPTARWFPSATVRSPREPYRLVPSRSDFAWPEVTARAAVGNVERLRSALPLAGGVSDYDVLGLAVHAFFAADVENLSDETRTERAERLLAAANLTGLVRPESLLEACNALREWVSSKWPDAVWRREVPVDATIPSENGDRRIAGVIDLLLETSAGIVIIDHKTFPGSSDSALRAKCATFVQQVAAYARMAELASSLGVAACWIHLPVAGAMVEIEWRPSA